MQIKRRHECSQAFKAGNNAVDSMSYSCSLVPKSWKLDHEISIAKTWSKTRPRKYYYKNWVENSTKKN